jgi:hypothetical protein
VAVGSGTGGGVYVRGWGGGAALRVVAGAGRFARVAVLAFTAVRAGAFAVGATFVVVVVCAGAAPAIAAARPPVAITAPAATPLVTNDSRLRARSRWWWAGG